MVLRLTTWRSCWSSSLAEALRCRFSVLQANRMEHLGSDQTAAGWAPAVIDRLGTADGAIGAALAEALPRGSQDARRGRPARGALPITSQRLLGLGA